MPDSNAQIAELNEKLQIYIQSRKTREDLKRIVAVYNRAIADCSPPILDQTTLIELEKMDFDMSRTKATYNRIFTKEVDALKDEQKEIANLYKGFCITLKDLKASLEILAAHCAGYDSTTLKRLSYAASLASQQCLTPCVNVELKKLTEKA